MTEEEAFLRAIAASPTDNTTRLVYADWLEERGDALSTVKANYLRTDARLSELAEGDSARDPLITRLRLRTDGPVTDWKTAVARVLIARLKILAGGPPIDWKTAVARIPLENCQLRWSFVCPMKWEQLQETADPRTRVCSACRKEVRYCDRIDEAQAVAGRGGCVAVDLRVPRRPGDLAPPMPPMPLGVIAPPRWTGGVPRESSE
jgi:uncharacterized protein (TIGR02996 family)